MIDISARHGEREVGVLIAGPRPPRRPLGTELGGADQPARLLGDVLPVAERQPVTALGGAAVDAREGVEAGGVDECKSGEIDDETHLFRHSRIELAVEHGCGCSVKRAAEPDDQRLSLAP